MYIIMNQYMDACDNLWLMIHTVNETMDLAILKQQWNYMLDEQQWSGDNRPSVKFSTGSISEITQRVYDTLKELMTLSGSTDHEDLLFAMCKNTEHCLYEYTVIALEKYSIAVNTNYESDSSSATS